MDRYTVGDAPNASIFLERNSRPSVGSVAQSLSAMADRNLHWRKDDADRVPRILGISLDRTAQLVAFSEMDR